MRLITFLMFVCAMNVSATGRSQERLSLNLKNAKLSEVFTIIQNQTDYQFIYNNEDVAKAPLINIFVNKVTVRQILKDCFQNYPLDYKIENKIVVISKKDKHRSVLINSSGILNITRLNGVSTNDVKDLMSSSIKKTIQFQVRGKVTDGSNNPLVGVSVSLKGNSSQGTTTNEDGEYALSLSGENGILVFTSIGFLNLEEEIRNREVINVTMQATASSLEQVIVVGYGTQEKKDITGSVTTLSSTDFAEAPQQSVQQLMRGKMSGINIIQNSGKPGGANIVRVRGGTSITASNDPLYVLDGVPLSVDFSGRQANIGNNGLDNIFNQEPINILNTINPNDIESITVLKDASATAIYGSRAANGVIVITTKGGKSGRVSTEFSTNLGVSSVSKKLDMLNSEQYLDEISELGMIADNGGEKQNNTYWQDKIYRDAASQEYNLSMNGGTENSRYRGSVGYSKAQGIIVGSKQSMYKGNFVSNQQTLNGHLLFDTRINYSHIDADDVPISNNIGGEDGTNMLWGAYIFNPTYPVFNSDGEFAQYSQFFINPLSYQGEILDNSSTNSLFGNFATTYKFLRAFNVKVNLGYTNNSITRKSYIAKENPLGGGNGGTANLQNASSWNKLIETTLGYHDYLDPSQNHLLDFIGGYSYQYFVDEGFRNTMSGFISDEFRWNSLQSASTMNNVSSFKQSNTLISLFGRINYGYKSKYLVTATLRRDGSSRFGSGNKWGVFPSGSVAWVISNENFFSDKSFVDNLKLRASYGITGNQEIGNLNSVTTLGAGTTGYVVGGVRQTLVLPTQYANPGLKWEETSQFDFGVDFEMFQGRFSGTIDYYRKMTSDLLMQTTVPSPSVVATQLANVGKVRNSGIEVALNGVLIDKENFTWNSGFNISANRNMVVSLSNENFATDNIMFGTVPGSGLTGVQGQIISVGRPLGTFWGPKFLGIDHQTGRELYSDEKEVIGNAFPDYIFGFNNTFQYKNFDLGVYLRGVVGNDLLNVTAINLSYKSNLPGRNILLSALNDGLDQGQQKVYSSRWIESGTFVKLDNLSLGYTFKFSNNDLFRSARISLAVRNLLTITNYSGQDPEVNSNTNGAGISPIGMDYLPYPKARVFTIGAILGF